MQRERMTTPESTEQKQDEPAGYGPFVDVERSGKEAEGTAGWEVEAYKGKSEVALIVEAATGKATVK
jgi:hypothetical protein